MKRIVWLVVPLMFTAGGCARRQDTSDGQVQRLSISEAKEKAVPPSGWKLAFVSNTGVTQPVGGGASALMDAQGKAGQWVFEYYNDKPTPVEEDGKKGLSYPFKAAVVKPEGVSWLPDTDLAVPKKLAELGGETLATLEQARNVAAGKVSKFDMMSVASDVNSAGTCVWRFRFYDLKSGEVVGKVGVGSDEKIVD
jgi:hypothetical protein